MLAAGGYIAGCCICVVILGPPCGTYATGPCGGITAGGNCPPPDPTSVGCCTAGVVIVILGGVDTRGAAGCIVVTTMDLGMC